MPGKTKYHFAISLLFSFLFGISQNKNIDSLTKALATFKEDTSQIKTLNKLSWEYVLVNKIDTAYILAKTALSKSEKINYEKGIGGAFNNFGVHYYYTAKYDSAEIFYYKSLRVRLRIKDHLGIAFSCGNIGGIYADRGNLRLAKAFYFKELQERLLLRDVKGMAKVLINVGRAYWSSGDLNNALSYYERGLQIYNLIRNEKMASEAYGNIGAVYYRQGNYPKALNHFLKALDLYEKNQNEQGAARMYTNIGSIYFIQLDHDKALKNYLKANDKYNTIGDPEGSTHALYNIGLVYNEKKNFDKAREYYLKSLEIAEKYEDKQAIATAVSGLGFVCSDKGEYQKALDYFAKAIKIKEELKDEVELSMSYASIGSVKQKQKAYKEAVENFNKSRDLSKKNQLLDIEKEAYMKLSEVYDEMNDKNNAFKNYKLFIQTRDSIFNEENTKKEVQSEMNFQFAKKQAADSLINIERRERDQIRHEQALKQQRTYTYGGLIGFVFMIIISGISFRAYKNKQKANQLISEQKMLVEQQKHLVEEKQREIIDSISYAKRLQNAILPTENLIKTYLPGTFILYKPKDIVAGDFYWFEKNKNKILFAAADCTGHGVPGAMVSVVCSNALNRSVKEFGLDEPGKILDKARELVLETFSKSGEDVKDGMDISLLAIDLSDKGDSINLSWSGANNPLWYSENGILKEVTAHKQAIGKTDDPSPFPTQKIKLEKGSMVYLITDGYADQFGGPKGKKFKYKQLIELLSQNQSKDPSDQKKALDNAFEGWRGGLEQIDDVTIIGIRV
jgi:tetratricopeptide (TPR) repeat protein